MKKIISFIMVVVSILLVSTLSVFGFTPMEGDLYYNLGATPGKDLTISTVSNGIKLDFKKTNDMWAARAELEYPFNLSKEKGISSKLTNISWPTTGSSVAFCISSVQGGWSDSRALIFRVSNGDTEGNFPNGAVEGIFGFGSEETDHSVVSFLSATALNNKITDSIDFSFKKKNNTQWALTINGQEFIVPNSVVSAKFTVMNPLYLNYGTWASAGAVSYIVSNVDFDGAFSDSSSSSSASSSSNSTSSSKATSSTVQSSSAVSSDDAQSSEVISSEAISSEQTLSSEISSNNSSVNSTVKDSPKKQNNVWLWILVVLFILVAGGGAAFYFLYFKKKSVK